MDEVKGWEDWKTLLGSAVNTGESAGLSDRTITNIAERVGTFLSRNVDPRNDEERLLKEMWDIADKKDRETLAKLVVKMVDK